MADDNMNVCTACGWLSAIVSCVCFGSFAVPIKSEAARQCNVDPLVFQSYKTFMCLTTAILIPPMLGQEYYFTPYGIVSGLFWVPAGVAAVYSVQNAGLALSQGLWSSIIVLVSFVWGIFIFGEEVGSKSFASLAILIMCIGLWGMSFFSSPHDSEVVRNDESDHGSGILQDGSDQEIDIKRTTNKYNEAGDGGFGYDGGFINDDLSSDPQLELNGNPLNRGEVEMLPYSSHETNDIHDSRREIIRQRRRGISSAIFNGIWGGSIMVPMQYAPPEASGIGYVLSFAVGASIVTVLLWILRFCYVWYKSDVIHSYNSLPSLHLKVMWAPGGLAGTLWSIGNIASMVSVQNLGEGVGYSVTQASMLVSGLWGIFYLNEVTSGNLRIKWFASAVITVFGILLLSHEHEG